MRHFTIAATALMLNFAPAVAADNTPAGDDSSTRAKEQTSATPGSSAETANKPLPSPGGERSSAPEGSSANDPSTPNSSLGGTNQDSKPGGTNQK